MGYNGVAIIPPISNGLSDLINTNTQNFYRVTTQ